MTLTKHQNKVSLEVLDNLKNKGMALLSGTAGVGKSFCTSAIAMHYLSKYKKVTATATTHKAVEVLERSMPKTIQSKTIHSYCNMRMIRNGLETKFIQDKSKPIEKMDLLIIDEFSMLTGDILEVLEQIHNSGTHILFVGDASQLIMDKDAINTLDIDSVSSFLTETIRQKEGSDIALYAKMASDFILGRASKPLIPYGSEIIQYDDHKDFIQAWKYVKTMDKVILAYQNNTVSAYNRNIKKNWLAQDDEFAIGNVITLRDSVHTKNNKLLFNKMRVEIFDVQHAYEGNAYEIFYTQEKDDSFMVPRTKAWMDTITKPLIESKNWSEYYEFKDKFTQVHHADAQTTHSSQGDTYNEVFIDGRDLMMMKTMDDLERAIYVAITRAKNKVHIFVGSERNYKAFKRKPDEYML